MPAAVPFAVITATMAIAGAMQAGTGMGFSLLSVPVLVLIDPHLVPGPLLLTAAVLTTVASVRDYRDLDRRLLARSCIGLVIGIALGTLVLKRFDAERLAPLFGALILFAVGLSLVIRRVPVIPPVVLGASVIGGFMGTLVGMCGPAIALVFQHERVGRTRAMLNAFALLNNLVALAALAATGLFGMRELRLGLSLMLGMALGLLLAPLVARYAGRHTLRPVILLVSALGGVALLFR